MMHFIVKETRVHVWIKALCCQLTLCYYNAALASYKIVVFSMYMLYNVKANHFNLRLLSRYRTHCVAIIN